MKSLRLGWALALVSAVFAASPFGCAEAITPGTGGQGGEISGPGGAGAGGTEDAGHDGPCVGPEDCAGSGDACNTGACVNGVCGKLPANENAACDDGKTCTQNDTCHAGVCVGGDLKPCPPIDGCHIGVCDVTLDACKSVPTNDGASCSDQDACTLSGVCSAGTCVATQMVDCSFLDGPCSIGFCDPQIGCKVTPQNDGTPCDDSLFCTINDVCTGGACMGTPNPCVPPNDVCLIGVCNEAQNACVTSPGNDGGACDDGNNCTTGEKCNGGLCLGGQPANNGAACDDGNACTSGTTCSNGACANAAQTIQACIDNDMCCPPGCPNDSDCAFKVLIVAADDSTGVDDIQAKLQGTGAFTGVDFFDAQFGTPTLAQLQPYKAVLTYSNFGFADAIGLGNVLADFFDAGGRVVVAPAAICLGGSIAGRFETDGYLMMTFGVVDVGNPQSLGSILEPGSQLVAGVSSFDAPFAARCVSSAVPGASVVAEWNDGLPLIVRGLVNGKKRVDVNVFPPSTEQGQLFWTGNGAEIMRNALLYK